LVAAQVNRWLLDATGLAPVVYSRYAAPLVEEALKAVWVVVLLRRGRVGFLVDAAILGFAVGAGFALVENVEYLRELAEPRVLLWLARGFGTAILHGATAAVFAMLAKALADRPPAGPPLTLVPGLAAAVAAHSLYNHFLVSPILAAGLLLVGLPLLVIVVFERSEQATRDWLGVGLDTDLELVEAITSGRALQTRVGEYLRSLKAHFPGEAVADMLCLLRIETELAIRAKGLLLAREAGLEAPVGDDARARITELRYLQRSIGRTGLLALKPLLRRGARDLWQVYFLEEAGGGGGKSPAPRRQAINRP
ncbi:MAG TPA: PrsW family glutamic-type intramembrane protease, partial [Vicinamibacteria bacterium]|nr:PrsW family glutamic-type intramembrane protease [Vicinamibacteria bacterium]